MPNTAHTEMGHPTHEAPTREYTHKHKYIPHPTCVCAVWAPLRRVSICIPKPMASIKDGSYALLRIPSSRIAKYIYAYRHMNGYFWRVLPSSSHSSHEHAHPSTCTCILHLFYTLPRLAACTLSGPHMHMHILPTGHGA